MTERVQRVLVLGATGHMGQAIIRHALAQGRAVTALTRRERPEALLGLPVTTVQIGSGLEHLAEAAKDHDLLVDAAGPYPMAPDVPQGAHWRAQVDKAVRRMERILEAAARNGMRLVHVSSCTTVRRPMSERQAAAAVWRRSVSPYFEAKAAMERTVMEAARSGLRAVIVNPSAFLGPW